ncbi:kinase-like protein [Xylariaceae sp. FL1651]|nr:kinase-like protein [Xylariaceae sp. FL1651]
MDNLKSAIKGLRRQNIAGYYYIPYRSLIAAMTADAIRDAFIDSSIPRYYQEETLNRVCKQGVKIFATLLLLGYPNHLSLFIEADQLDDAKLPLKAETLFEEIHLPKEVANDFAEKQWELIVPTFQRGTLNRRFGANVVLPFTQDKRIGKGAFGTVYEVTIDEDHQAPGDSFPRIIARKEFTVEHDHRKELENLSILNHLKHPNIAELLSSFVQKDKYSLLFHFAKDGDLDEFLAKERHCTQFLTNQSLVDAFAALCSAVAHVHNFSQSKLDLQLIGLHHDLRPRNVLVSDGRFILADFGISTLKPYPANSETPFKNGSDDYLAPECEDWDDGFQAGKVHRSADVWSLGCILAEVVTYMAWGPQGVGRFREARRYKVRGWILRQFHHGPRKSSEAVSAWLSDLEQLGSTTITLLVDVVRQILSLNFLQRPTAEEVTRELQVIAIYEAASNINTAFSSIRGEYPSLDISLEHLRFNAWMLALGLFNFKDEPKSLRTFVHKANLQYDEIKETLTRLSTNLDARQKHEPSVQYLDFSSLSSLNDKLQSFLTSDQREKSREYFLVNLTEEPELSSDEIENWAMSGSVTHEIRLRVKLKYINNILTDDHNPSLDPSLKLDPNAIKELVAFGDHHRGRLIDQRGETRPVWVEWHRYGKHEAKQETIERLYGRATQTARLLAADKPESFRSLACCGFFHEAEREAFGMVFEFPDSADNRDVIQPIDLRQRIADSLKKHVPYPDLDDRFQLATTLVATLFEFHSVGWLHKSLMSSNIIFFPKVSSKNDADISNPQYHSNTLREPFLVGFNHSRPDDPLSLTSAPPQSDLRHYHHPAYLKDNRGYRLEYDYYSLGIILLEIGFWMPLAKITEGWVGTYDERRQRLLERRVPRLRQHMGRGYSEAVRFCLESKTVSDSGTSGRGDHDQGISRKELMLQFAQCVMARLRAW